MVAFLCTRVQELDKDDWKKLLRLMEYLNGTRDLKLNLVDNGSGILWWSVDSLYEVHVRARSHTGGTPYNGEGFSDQ